MHAQVKGGLAEAQQQLQAARAKKRAAPLVCRLLRGALTVVATLALQRLHQVPLWTPSACSCEDIAHGRLVTQHGAHACLQQAASEGNKEGRGVRVLSWRLHISKA